MQKLRTSRALGTLAVFAIAGLGLSACAANTDSTSGTGKNKLEITSWWTSGSESAALDVLIAADKKADPGVSIENAAVSGGGGSNAHQALAARLSANDPPATWQLHPDGQLESYVAGGQVADISALWAKEGWAKDMPASVAAGQAVNGKYYTVPVGVHRGNVVWTNPSVLSKAGVTIDPKGSIDDLIAGLKKVKATGVTPVCLGDKDIFASSELLETILFSTVGSENWNALIAGKSSWDSPDVKKGLNYYKQILALSNTDHSSLTWDQASGNLLAGKCAINVMGDWAYGELTNAKGVPEKDFGWTLFPGKEDVFDYVGDGFSIPAKNNPNLKASEIWLKTIMDPKVQTAFAAKKGSIPALSTADTSSLSKYQQESAASFKSGVVLSSLAQGQASTAEFTQTYADAVTTLNGDGNIDSFISTLDAAQKAN